jgi:hypothetical protein
MGDAIGQVLSLAVGVAISPVPIIAVVLMLGTPRARVNGPAFLAGWVFGLALVGAIVLLLASGAGAEDGGEPATWASVLELVLGLLLLALAVKQWRGRPRQGDEAQLPKWMQAIDRFTATRATVMGAALSGVNPKNLLLTIGAGAAIAQTGVDTGDQAIAMAVFVVVGTLGPAIPVGIYFLMGHRATELLADLKAWMAANNAGIMAVLMLVIGAKLIGDGISGLA